MMPTTLHVAAPSPTIAPAPAGITPGEGNFAAALMSVANGMETGTAKAQVATAPRSAAASPVDQIVGAITDLAGQFGTFVADLLPEMPAIDAPDQQAQMVVVDVAPVFGPALAVAAQAVCEGLPRTRTTLPAAEPRLARSVPLPAGLPITADIVTSFAVAEQALVTPSPGFAMPDATAPGKSGIVFSLLPQPAEAQPIARQLDLARDSLWLDDLARDIVAAGDGGGRLSFRLSPPALGALDISLYSGERGLGLAMTTSTEDAARIISAGTARLVDELRAQGVRVASADVLTGSGHGHDKPHDRSQQSNRQPPFIETGFRADDRPNALPVPPTGLFA